MNARTAVRAATVRCAIYTRKSSEEGLDQAYNSLHAQRDACEAYIRSQAGEGWELHPAEYDDGGYSGGDMGRPALKRLLEDIRLGAVDTVVVYKVDRLTRSLSDFARIVEIFDQAGASFVSVTQAFNTTTSMGRLTLNVLLSFAQFEREVTGERIRDKIAASKAKGMWMGGFPPLGYRSADRRLVVVPEEAETVRLIFERYLKIGSVHLLRDELGERGIFSKAWVTSAGGARGGQPFSRGALFYLLRNRTYRGEIVHKDTTYPGQHEAIVDHKLFDAVQRRLQANRVRRRHSQARAPSAPLTGRIFDSGGRAYTATFSYGRHGRLYRYYVRSDLQQGCRAAAADVPHRLPGDPLDSLVLDLLRRVRGRPDDGWDDLGSALRRLEVRASDTHLLLDAGEVFAGDHPELAFEDFRSRLGEGERAVLENDSRTIRLALPRRLQFRGGRTWSSQRERKGDVAAAPLLLSALRRAHLALTELGVSHETPIEGLNEAKPPSDSYIRRLVRLAFLAPEIQADIVSGHHRGDLTITSLTEDNVPFCWKEQIAWWRRLNRAGVA